MEIVYRKTSDLIPYVNNAKIHDQNVKAITNSIKEFGFKNPIIVDSENVVVAGHGRLKAAEQIGMQEVPVIVADDLTDEQVQAYRLVDNKVSELAEYDLDLLREELDAIKLIDMEDFGFDDNENNFEEESVENDVTEDSFTGEVPEEPKSVRGELYQLGSHRLMCGDSTSVTDVSELMDGKPI